MWVESLGQEDPLEEGRATHSSILSWRIPGTEEPGRLQSIGSKRVGHNWSDLACMHAPKVFNHPFLPRKVNKKPRWRQQLKQHTLRRGPHGDCHCTACHRSSKAKRRKGRPSLTVRVGNESPEGQESWPCAWPRSWRGREHHPWDSLGKKETFIPEQSPSHAAAQLNTDNSVHTTSSYNPSSDLSNKKNLSYNTFQLPCY